MQRPNIKTAKNVTPMIYAYTTPEIARHDGWTKIGYTEQDVETRIKQQTHTADISVTIWNGKEMHFLMMVLASASLIKIFMCI